MINSIHQLNEQQAVLMIKELVKLDKNINKKVKHVMDNSGCSLPDALEYIVYNSPMLWAKVYLNWEARDYQKDILDQGKKSKKLVLRLGRRLGKSECQCILILWHAFTQHNKGPNGQYNVLIVTPYETQIDLIFKRLKQLIDLSPILKDMIARDINHKLEFKNGSIITGLTAGTKSSSGAASTRGQRADLIVLDEADYLNSSDITNIVNIRNEAPERIKLLVASTPSGRHQEYWKWCCGASLKFTPTDDDIANSRFTEYEKISTKGNGWTEIFAPSIVNPELLKINPDTNQTYLADLKDELTQIRFEQEVMAGFGEEEAGVYKQPFLLEAMAEGKRIGHKYLTELSPYERDKYLSEHFANTRILGIDWDRLNTCPAL